MKTYFYAATLLFLGLAGFAAQAQTIGAGVVLAEINENRFSNAAGAGVWLSIPVSDGGWHAGLAGSFLQSNYHYHKHWRHHGHWHNHRYKGRYKNRMSTATLFVTKEVLQKNEIGLLLGPALSYSSIGVRRYSVFADRVFAGAWVNANYKLTDEFKIELVLHPRFSPGGNGRSLDAYDPYSGEALFVFEAWLGASYTFGK